MHYPKKRLKVFVGLGYIILVILMFLLIHLFL